MYKNAKQFIVDRFLDEDGEKKAPPILTFGAPGSAHHCIGYAFANLQIKSLIAAILRSYNIELDETQTRGFKYQRLIQPKSGVVLKSFTRRQ